ncbi:MULTISPECIES: hypothetical protein [unclassified Sporosarcina]|uniref:hypothetical protein n=1 Tax=unclassified Sporosarcina TaxID=2647733 RepID=UPI001A90EADA|nr:MULTISPECIES: hypothetical protein [unclassified Sporosarcina]MBO0588371.1 hypothetical protein [Sporosarcina sp. E16_8]MBO0603636.1 hypothetical protein [Sporosarcina sp. E16_3]
MYNVCLLELKRCLRRIEFKFVFVILLLLPVVAHLIQCAIYFGKTFSYLRPYEEMTFIVGNYVSHIFSIFIILTPLLSSFIYSDNYFIDRKKGILTLLVTRTKRQYVLIAKAFTVTFVTFFSFFVVLCINFLLTYITFPEKGGDNMYALPAYDTGLQGYNSLYAFDLLSLNHPFGYSLIYAFLVSLFAGMVALLSFSIMTLTTKNRYLTVIGLFVGLIVIDLLFSFLGFFNYGWTSVFFSNSLVPEWAPFAWIIGLFAFSVLLLIRAKKSDVMN